MTAPLEATKARAKQTEQKIQDTIADSFIRASQSETGSATFDYESIILSALIAEGDEVRAENARLREALKKLPKIIRELYHMNIEEALNRKEGDEPYADSQQKIPASNAGATSNPEAPATPTPAVR